MKQLILLYFSLTLILMLKAQKNERFSFGVNYGLNGNFFVINYPENAPPPITPFYKKKFLGTIGGIEGRYNLSSRSSFGLEFSKSNNKKLVNYYNGSNAGFRDFNINHTNYFYAFDYERAIEKKKNKFSFQFGLYYLRMKMQEVDFTPIGVIADERNFENSNLEDGGLLFGVNYFRKIDTKLEFGVKSKIYYNLGTISFEAITITPSLRYTL